MKLKSGFVSQTLGDTQFLVPMGGEAFSGVVRSNETALNRPRAAECRDCAYEAVCSSCPADALKYAEPGKLPAGLCERTRYMVSRGVLPFSHCDPKEAMTRR